VKDDSLANILLPKVAGIASPLKALKSALSFGSMDSEKV